LSYGERRARRNQRPASVLLATIIRDIILIGIGAVGGHSAKLDFKLLIINQHSLTVDAAEEEFP
jgi:hypothetical protein